MSYLDWDALKKRFFFDVEHVPMINEDTPTFMGRVVIIGSSYVAGNEDSLWGVDIEEWAASPKRVRQQSVRYPSGYIQDFDLDVFSHLNVVDYGDADLPSATSNRKSYETVMTAQRSVEKKVNDALDVGAVPIVIGQNSPCGSYAIAKPISERTSGNVGVVSLDTHWDIDPIDEDTMDPRIAGAASWKSKMYEFQKNMLVKNLVEIGERGMLEDKELVRTFLRNGAHFYPMWKVRQMGIEELCNQLAHAYENTEAVYAS